MCSISDDPEQVSYFVVKLRHAGKSGTAQVKRVANGVRETLAVAAGSWRLTASGAGPHRSKRTGPQRLFLELGA